MRPRSRAGCQAVARLTLIFSLEPLLHERVPRPLLGQHHASDAGVIPEDEIAGRKPGQDRIGLGALGGLAGDTCFSWGCLLAASDMGPLVRPQKTLSATGLGFPCRHLCSTSQAGGGGYDNALPKDLFDASCAEQETVFFWVGLPLSACILWPIFGVPFRHQQ